MEGWRDGRMDGWRDGTMEGRKYGGHGGEWDSFAGMGRCLRNKWRENMGTVMKGGRQTID